MEKTVMKRPRPILGGTNDGERPKRYAYWRTGYGVKTHPKLDFWVAQAGEYHCNADFKSGAFEHHNRLQFYYQTDGVSTIVGEQFRYQVQPHELLIIPPFQPFSFFADRPIKLHWFALEGELPAIFDFGLTVLTNLKDGRKLVDRFTAVRELLISQPTGYALQGVGLAYEILSLLQADVQVSRSDSQYPEILQKALYFLDEGCRSAYDSKRLIQHLGISQSYCRQLFRKYVGESPKKVHARLRMAAAERLLLTQNLTVKEVATELGFHDPYHFSKAFKKEKGVSPNRFKGQTGR